MTEKYTKDGVPIISRQTLDSLRAIALRGDGPELIIKEFKERLLKENKGLADYLEHVFAGAFQGDVFDQGVATGFYIIYEAIRNQSASHKLEEQIEK